MYLFFYPPPVQTVQVQNHLFFSNPKDFSTLYLHFQLKPPQTSNAPPKYRNFALNFKISHKLQYFLLSTFFRIFAD